MSLPGFNSGSSAMQTALIRGAYTAVGVGLAAGVPLWMAGASPTEYIGAAILAALTALGFRGGVEGAIDTQRDQTEQAEDEAWAAKAIRLDPEEAEVLRQWHNGKVYIEDWPHVPPEMTLTEAELVANVERYKAEHAGDPV